MRETFEKQFLDELAFAACLPPENIRIEEIHRLDVNSIKLKNKLHLKRKEIEKNVLLTKVSFPGNVFDEDSCFLSLLKIIWGIGESCFGCPGSFA